ncbi:stage V sporulation protein AE [Pontibacillus salipaludis]|uniref:Stage V sporulation protein AE n=1 Tax=Pontibacillus salipaludis TaxID=1697394 RepID=A0ABQ1PND3_9BACI|nr:stage V sporulation protein AE [Pontibacillus salipaludis]GGD00069.1 stage V sporulation protein AE [Pontibacillus salipaludis]
MLSKKVIVITDGDEYARKAIDYLAGEVGGTSLAQYSANPTTASSEEIIKAVNRAKEEPVYVLLDDAGIQGVGPGERVLLDLAKESSITIIGAIAVASHTRYREWSRFTFAIDRKGEIVAQGVDKEGEREMEIGRISGDTVYSLDELDIPTVVAIGDIGKMYGQDDLKKGVPITRKAIELILERADENEERE